MAKTNSHIPTVLKDFEQRHGRKPKTLDEYRWIAAVAKGISAIEAARLLAAEGSPDAMDEYFGYARDHELVWN